jgi:hypothetical protein
MSMGPNIINEGCIFAIDALNDKTAAGSSIVSQTDPNITGSATNGASIVSYYYDFDGTDDHYLFTGSYNAGYQEGVFNSINVTDAFTCEVWVNMPDASGTGGHIFANGGNDDNPLSGLGPSRGWSLGFSPNANTGTGIIGFRMYKDGSNNRAAITGVELNSADTWYHIVWVMYGTTDFNVSLNSNWDCYVNGVQASQGSPPGDGGTIDDVRSINPFLVGARPGADPGPGGYPTIQSPFLGKLGLARIYKDKAFTSQEALHNYNVMKHRFGIK